MSRGRFRPGYPLSVSDLNDLNRVANSGQPRVLGSSMDVAGGESGMAVQPTKTLDGHLRCLQVVAAVTGGYSFFEVYDPQGDGSYEFMPHGMQSSGTSVILVPRSGATLGAGDIVIARQNPFNPLKWEALCMLSGLITINADGTAGGGTNKLIFDQATGIRKVEVGTDDYIRLIEAQYNQWGAVSTADQTWTGYKIFRGPMAIGQSVTAGGLSAPYTLHTAVGGGTGGTAGITSFTSITPSTYALMSATAATAVTSASPVPPTTPQYISSTHKLSLTLPAGAVWNSGLASIEAVKHVAFVDVNTLRASVYSAYTPTGLGGTDYGPSLVIGCNADETKVGIAFGTETLPRSAPGSAVTMEWDIYADLSSSAYYLLHTRNFIATDTATHGAVRGVDLWLGQDVDITLNTGSALQEFKFRAGHLCEVGSTSPLPPPPPLAAGSVGTAELADDAVTYAKMQNVSAAARFIGRGAGAGAGDPQEISLDSSLSMSGTTLSVGTVDGGTW